MEVGGKSQFTLTALIALCGPEKTNATRARPVSPAMHGIRRHRLLIIIRPIFEHRLRRGGGRGIVGEAILEGRRLGIFGVV